MNNPTTPAQIAEAIEMTDIKALVELLGELPKFTLWAVGSMEDGPFARLCWPMPNGSYVGGYVQTTGETVAEALGEAIRKGQALSPLEGRE